MEKSKIKDLSTSPNPFDMVQKEVNIHRRLHHDHIVRLYSYFEDEKAFYLVKNS